MRTDMAAPILNNWRRIGVRHGSPGILVGEVSGHPLLPDGWITTSAVRDIAEDRSHAHTASRRYDLATPLPDDNPLPKAAKDAILTRLVRNAARTPSIFVPNAIELQRLTTFVEELSEAPVKPNL
jgi:hypothetical protein